MSKPLTRREVVGGAAAGAALVTLRGAPALARPRRRSAEVVVVGAGLSGLAAARRLHRAGVDVVVLEARDRVGGRTLNTTIAPRRITELGGEYVGPTQERIVALANAVGIGTYRTYNRGANVQITGGVRSLYPADPGLPTDPAIGPALRVGGELGELAQQVPVSAPWRSRRAREWDRQTLEDFIRPRLTTPASRAGFDATVQAIWGAEPRELSLLYVLAYTAGAGDERNPGDFARLFTTPGGAQERRLVGGSQLVSQRVARALGRRVLRRAPVRRIVRGGDGVRVVADELVVEASRVIVAVPPVLAGRIGWTPALPAAKRAILRALTPGTLVKAEAIYPRPFWRDAGLSGQGFSDVGIARVPFDNSPPEGDRGVLFSFIGGARHAAWAALRPSARRRRVLEDLARFVGDRALRPDEYLEHDWSAERWTLGCPTGHLGPGVLTRHGPALRAATGRVHWAGTETSDFWQGYMDGAVRAGERAADEVLVELPRR
jgi:monoamine oxidase